MPAATCWLSLARAQTQAQARARAIGRSVSSHARHVRCYNQAAIERPVQSYISRSSDPYLNLSIEHHLLQKSPADSTVLLFYINRPCVVIGRNQNPWSEVDHAVIRRPSMLNAGEAPNIAASTTSGTRDALSSRSIDLVRRRSGGGTVFHDAGNVNWSVICPTAQFTRDKHAAMVVRALRRCGASRARVNERHDIVLDQGRGSRTTLDRTVTAGGPDDIDDPYSTPWTATNPLRRGALKVSGSAYKLTRGRALHHGTALLGSANLSHIPGVLSSPARPWIRGRGVDSVSSPVGNVKIGNEQFVNAVRDEFGAMYVHVDPVEIGEEWLENEDVRKGYDELRSPTWTYLQTPQFTISNRVFDDKSEGSSRTSGPELSLDVRNGVVTEANLSGFDDTSTAAASFAEIIAGQAIHEITDWHGLFAKAGLLPKHAAFAHWLEHALNGQGPEADLEEDA